MKLFFIFGLLLAVSARGNCALSVAYLGAGPDSPPPLQLIADTHRQLFAALKNPAMLSRRLYEFEKMLWKKGWLTPDVMNALIANGADHFDELSGARAAVDAAVLTNAKPVFHFPTSMRGGRRWIVFPSQVSGVEVADLQAGTQVHVDNEVEGWNHYVAVADAGDTIALAQSHGVGLRTFKFPPGSAKDSPLAEIVRKRGVLDWPFSQYSKAKLSHLEPGPEPHLWLASYLAPDGLFLFDTKAGTVKKISSKLGGVPLTATWSRTTWKRVRETRDYAIEGDIGFEDHSAKKALVSATLTPEGELGRPTTWILWSGVSRHPTYAWGHDGNTVYRAISDKVIRIERDGTQTTVPFEPPKPDLHVTDLRATEDGKYLDILILEHPNGILVGRYSLADKTTVWTKVPERGRRGDPRLSADGTRVIYPSGEMITTSRIIPR